MIRRILIEAVKLIKLWIKDPKIILGGLIAPLVILLAFYLMFGSLPPFKIGVINNDPGNYGASLVKELKTTVNPAGSTYFQVIQSSSDDLDRMYLNDRIVAILTIPADFSEGIKRGTEPGLLYQINNYNTDFAKNLRLYLDEVLLKFYNKNYNDVSINIIEEYQADRFNWFKSISLSVIVLSFILGGSITAIYFYQKEKIAHTIINFSLSPYNILVFVLPHYILAVFIGILSACGTTLVIYLLNGPVNGILFIFMISIIGSLPYIGLGLIVYRLLSRYMPAAIITMMTAIISWFLGGAIGPIDLTISKLFPVYYSIDIIRGVLLYNDFTNFTRNIVVLSIYALFIFYITIILHRYRVEK